MVRRRRSSRAYSRAVLSSERLGVIISTGRLDRAGNYRAGRHQARRQLLAGISGGTGTPRGTLALAGFGLRATSSWPTPGISLGAVTLKQPASGMPSSNTTPIRNAPIYVPQRPPGIDRRLVMHAIIVHGNAGARRLTRSAISASARRSSTASGPAASRQRSRSPALPACSSTAAAAPTRLRADRLRARP